MGGGLSITTGQLLTPRLTNFYMNNINNFDEPLLAQSDFKDAEVLAVPSKPFTCIAKSHGAPAVPATKEEWEAVRNSKELVDLCEKIRNAKTDEEVRKLKSKLPVWTPRCKKFKDNHRSEKDVEEPLTTLVLDIDEKGHTDEIVGKVINGHIGRYEILLIEDSIRLGTHAAVELPEGMTPNEVQKEFAELIGLPVDPAVKNEAGCIYQVPISHTKYINPKLFNPSPLEQKEAAPIPSEEPSSANVEQTPTMEKKDTLVGFEDYNGIAWSTIIDKYIELFWNGKEPVEGSRNSSVYDITKDFACICDYRQDVLETIIPRWANFPEAEHRQTIANALKEPKKGTTFRMRKVLEALGAPNKQQGNDSRPPLPPKRLPGLLRLLSKHAPNHTKVAVVENVWAALGTHLSGVKFRYIDNVLHEATFMCFLFGPQSVGKGYIVKPIEAILKPIREKDAISRKKEAEYKRKNPSGAKKVKDPRPTDICIQVLADDLTDAAFSQRVFDAEMNGEKYIYVRVDEIELLKKLTSSKKAEDVWLIIRKAFDNAEHGQERVGSDSVSGIAHLRFLCNVSTTEARGVDFFKGAINDGTLTRICLSTIQREDMDNDDGEVPIQGDYDQKFHDELKPYLDRLENAKGIIRCRQAEKLAKDMAKENYENALLLESEAYRTFSYRANVIAYLKAMVLYIANNCKWSKDIETYVRWSYQYDIWCKMHYFGATLDRAVEAEKNLHTGDPRSLLSQLGEEFTREEFINLRLKLGKKSDPRQILSQWKKRGYIVQEPISQKYIKTPKGLEK